MASISKCVWCHTIAWQNHDLRKVLVVNHGHLQPNLHVMQAASQLVKLVGNLATLTMPFKVQFHGE